MNFRNLLNPAVEVVLTKAPDEIGQLEFMLERKWLQIFVADYISNWPKCDRGRGLKSCTAPSTETLATPRVFDKEQKKKTAVIGTQLTIKETGYTKKQIANVMKILFFLMYFPILFMLFTTALHFFTSSLTRTVSSVPNHFAKCLNINWWFGVTIYEFKFALPRE